MNIKSLSQKIMLLLLGGALLFGAGLSNAKAQEQVQAQSSIYLPVVLKASGEQPTTDKPTVNAPYFPNNGYSYAGSTVFWFGKVNSTAVYADVRVGYNDTEIIVSVNLIDRYLWYDPTPSVQDMSNWDAVSLYLSTSGNPGAVPGGSDTRWLAQLGNSSNRSTYQSAWRGNGTTWVQAALPFSTEVRFQGGVNGAGDGKGWSLNYHIPMSSLGHASAPIQGTKWRLGVILHDRDTASGPMRPNTVWPAEMEALNPGSWAVLNLGLPMYQPPSNDYDGLTIIRHGVQGVVVEDAHVGGNFTCGENIDHWSQWGDTNYEADTAANDPTQINIQNQWHIDDWPCFSKYFVTFPLDTIPAGAEVISATLTLYHFGNSDPANAQDSAIHAFVVRQPWDDHTITWNNAPQAWMNLTRLRVRPLTSYPGWPGIPRIWNVSLAVQEASDTGGPLRLALYSSDYERHSGKYFYSSNSVDGSQSARPYLTVWWKLP